MALHLSYGCLKILERFNDLSRVSRSVRRERLDPRILNRAPGLPHDIVVTGGAWNFSTLPPKEYQLQGYRQGSDATLSFQLIFGKTARIPPI